MKYLWLLLISTISLPVLGINRQPLFNMQEIMDASTLDVEVIQDWHRVEGSVDTRQKFMTIRVGELWRGQDLRIPVRLVVPADRKAKGFHLTGGNQLKQIREDRIIRGTDQLLLEGGVGLVQTLVQNFSSIEQAELGKHMNDRFIETLNPHYSVQYWGWPAIIMRSVTAAYAETDYVEEGKVAVSGGSKNGASPSVAIIADKRITALHASVSPPWESPLRLCDRTAWDDLLAYNKKDGVTKQHQFLGGAFGPRYNEAALNAGHKWDNLRELALDMADYVFVSKNLAHLKERGVDLLFHPGTHDFVAFDLAWGGKAYPQIPTYLSANSGHGQNKNRHPMGETDVQNLAAFLLNHFFDEVDDLLEPPELEYSVSNQILSVTVKFSDNMQAESGRIWWLFDRGPDGSEAYLRDLIPDNQWSEMNPDLSGNIWSVEISLDTAASHIDIFSNHRKTLRFMGKEYITYISSPYTRIFLK